MLPTTQNYYAHRIVPIEPPPSGRLLRLRTVFFPDKLYAQSHSADFCYYHLGHGFYIFIVHADKAEAFCLPFIEKDQWSGSLIWHTLRLYNAQIEIYPESRGLFLPHRLGLHKTQYISFNKGCYKGQEIIARTHYKATLKHELKLHIITTDEKLYSGQKLFKVNESAESGELIDYAPLGNYRINFNLSII